MQEKPKKAGLKEVNGQKDDFKENGIDANGTVSIDGTTNASLNTTSTATLNEAVSAKQPANRATLQEAQMSQKVNQDLFYNMPAEE